VISNVSHVHDLDALLYCILQYNYAIYWDDFLITVCLTLRCYEREHRTYVNGYACANKTNCVEHPDCQLLSLALPRRSNSWPSGCVWVARKIYIELSGASPYEICVWTILYTTYATCSGTSRRPIVILCVQWWIYYIPIWTLFATWILFAVDTKAIWLLAYQRYEAFKMTYLFDLERSKRYSCTDYRRLWLQCPHYVHKKYTIFYLNIIIM
jgi:hypothetical protein